MAVVLVRSVVRVPFAGTQPLRALRRMFGFVHTNQWCSVAGNVGEEHSASVARTVVIIMRIFRVSP